MSIIELPHKVADFACPINGLEDMYEWKTGNQLPGYFLMDLSMIGFMYLKNKKAPVQRMVCWGNGTGRVQHELLSDILGYQWTFSEGKSFKTAWKEICASVDRGIPVILGMLDMFYLPYYPRFYHKMHIPQHYVLLVSYDNERGEAYVKDNGHPDVKTITIDDLRESLNIEMPGQVKKNTFCIVEFGDQIAPLKEIAEKGLKKKASLFLNPPVGFMGIKGLRHLAKDIMNWQAELSPQQIKESLTFLVTFTCSTVPMPPQRLLSYPINHPDTHQAIRDRFSRELSELAKEFQHPEWEQSSCEFALSGELIGQLTDAAVDQILAGTSCMEKMSDLISEIAKHEEKAFQYLR